MDYDALTIDTQTVETNGFHFEGKLLAQLKQFAGTSPMVVVSEVVISEILRHLQTKTSEAKEAVESAHRKAQQFGLKAATETPFVEAPDTQAVAKARLTGYLNDIGATIILAKTASMDDVFQLYKKGSPPFSTAGKKKNEFPDAIALVSLEQWCKKNNKHILAASGDKDWQAFGEKSEHIDVVPELSIALTRLQEDAEKANIIVQKILTGIKSGTEPELGTRINELLAEGISSSDVNVDGSSAFQFEVESVELRLERFEFSDYEGEFFTQIVQSGRSTIAAKIELTAFISAEGNFSLAAWDSIDDEWVDLGSSTVQLTNQEYFLEVLVTFEGDFEQGAVDIEKIEIMNGLEKINFGEIEIDYEDEYPEPDIDFDEVKSFGADTGVNDEDIPF